MKETFHEKEMIGKPAPLFELTDQDGNIFRMADHAGKHPLVVFFYPADDTPGCTREACSFRDSYEAFRSAGARVVGISSDPPESHRDFAGKHRLPYPLLSDTDQGVRRLFGVKPDLFGMVPGRVTFVIDEQGIIREAFRSQFRPGKHVEQALRFLKLEDTSSGSEQV